MKHPSEGVFDPVRPLDLIKCSIVFHYLVLKTHPEETFDGYDQIHS